MNKGLLGGEGELRAYIRVALCVLGVQQLVSLGFSALPFRGKSIICVHRYVVLCVLNALVIRKNGAKREFRCLGSFHSVFRSHKNPIVWCRDAIFACMPHV